ncbi:MAG: MarR family transcriptional regulator [Hyphomicrobiaceae bacterium]|nr:MarR family transcriptional regulator [Hyphomicrobiaceae bacterium]
MTRKTAPDAAADAISKHRLRLWLRLLKATRLVSAELRDRLREGHQTTLPRFDVMSALYRHEKGLRMSDLSSVLKVSNGNVTGIVNRLASEGYIVRVPVRGDRRATVVRLTRKGREHFAELAALHEGWVDELFGVLDPEETRLANALLTRLDDALDARRAGKEDAAEAED